jgi:hypothetical protein
VVRFLISKTNLQPKSWRSCTNKPKENSLRYNSDCKKRMNVVKVKFVRRKSNSKKSTVRFWTNFMVNLKWLRRHSTIVWLITLCADRKLRRKRSCLKTRINNA